MPINRLLKDGRTPEEIELLNKAFNRWADSSTSSSQVTSDRRFPWVSFRRIRYCLHSKMKWSATGGYVISLSMRKEMVYAASQRRLGSMAYDEPASYHCSRED
jgi:hypothetical protein